MSVKQVTAYKTSDGVLYEDKVSAELADHKAEFRAWCQTNICIGGEWSAGMVADAILDNWDVKEKPF